MESGTVEHLDSIPELRDVLFVGEFFSAIVSVRLLEEFREPAESDDDLAVRLASTLFSGVYGWDIRENSLEVGVVA